MSRGTLKGEGEPWNTTTSTTASTASKCPICLEYFIEDNLALLPCGHVLCIEPHGGCLVAYITSMVNSGMVLDEELVCPYEDCKKPLGHSFIRWSLEGLAELAGDDAAITTGHALFNKYCEFAIRAWKPLKSVSGEVECTVHCPKSTCMSFFVVGEADFSQPRLTCPDCKATFCPRCRLDAHEGTDCEQHRAEAKTSEDRDDSIFNELLLKSHWKRCPLCAAPVEKSGGCSLMSCTSATCRGKTHFCYVCGEKLTMKQHYSHFKGQPYAEFCINKPRPRGKKQVVEETVVAAQPAPVPAASAERTNLCTQVPAMTSESGRPLRRVRVQKESILKKEPEAAKAGATNGKRAPTVPEVRRSKRLRK